MQTLKLGIIGSGFVAQFHARALEQVRRVEIAGVTEHLTVRSVQAHSDAPGEHPLAAVGSDLEPPGCLGVDSLA